MPEPATAKSAKRFLAHVRQQVDGSYEIHDLEGHLRAVAKIWRNLATYSF